MKISRNSVLAITGVLILLALGAWWWSANMRKEWYQEERATPEAARQPFLAATWLLRQSGFKVKVVESTAALQAAQLPDGTLLVGGSRGIFTDAKLLAWVRRGNTLVYQPRMLTKEEKKVYAIEGEEDSPAAAQDEEHPEETGADDNEDAVTDEEDAEAADEPQSQPDKARPQPAEAAEERYIETDIVGALVGVRSDRARRTYTCSNLSKKGVEPDDDFNCPAGMLRAWQLAQINFLGSGNLTFDAGFTRLVATRKEPAPIWSDSTGVAVQGYRVGKGTIVIAPGHLFANRNLQQHDHGALLLAFAGLADGKHVTIVKSSDFTDWKRLLWQHYRMAVIAFGALLALLFWAAVRRFGPMLPVPELARRSLMEHIDASGAWLWKARGGRQVLIDAARADLHTTLQRRAPAVLRLPEAALHDELARLTGLPATDIAHAMHYEPAALNAEFTRQIRTLQTLRKHYER